MKLEPLLYFLCANVLSLCLNSSLYCTILSSTFKVTFVTFEMCLKAKGQTAFFVLNVFKQFGIIIFS